MHPFTAGNEARPLPEILAQHFSYSAITAPRGLAIKAFYNCGHNPGSKVLHIIVAVIHRSMVIIGGLARASTVQLNHTSRCS